MATMKAIMADRLYIPLDWIEEQGKRSAFLNQFTYKFKRRHHTYAQKGETYVELVKTYDIGKKYIRFERGDYKKVKSIFGKCPLSDRRVAPSFSDDYPELEFTSVLRPEQETAVVDWLKAKHGIIKAPTRWGKMFVMVNIAVQMGMRFLGLAHTKELRDQMEEEFRLHTNINEVESAHDTKLIGVYDAERKKAGRPFPVATFATYQSFLSDRGKQTLEEIKKDFGLVWVTESHLAPAKCFSNVLSGFWARHKGGDTATPNRKDGTEVVMFDVLGPITAEGSTEQMDPKVVLHYTGMKVPERLDNWTRLINKLSTDDDRNKNIIFQVMEDADAGRHVIVLTERVKHTLFLTNYLKQDKRDEVLADAKSGRIQITVAVAKIVQHGITVPLWDCVHLTMPSNNKATVEQRVGRVRTPYPGKPRPIIRDWVDWDANPLIFYTLKTRKGVYTKLGFDITSNLPPSTRESSAIGMRKGGYKPI